MSVQFLKKVTIKTVYGKVQQRDIPKDGEIEIGTFYGRAMDKKHVSTNLGDSICLLGDFRAINARGEHFAGMQMYLPPVAAAHVAAGLNSGGAVEFAFRIGARDNAESPVGYEYTVTPVNVSQDGKDPMDRLTQLVTGKGPAQLEHKAPETAREAADARKPKAKK